MKLRKVISSILCAVIAITAGMNLVSADSISLDTIKSSTVASQEPDFITFDEYLEGYGVENVINGFKSAERENAVTVLGIEEEVSIQSSSNEALPNDLFLSLSEGKFLGLEILGISDLSPDDVHLTLKLRNDNFLTPPLPNEDASGYVEPNSMVT